MNTVWLSIKLFEQHYQRHIEDDPTKMIEQLVELLVYDRLMSEGYHFD